MRFRTAGLKLAVSIVLSALGVAAAFAATAHPSREGGAATTTSLLPNTGTPPPPLYPKQGCGSTSRLTDPNPDKKDFLCGTAHADTITAGPNDVVLAGGGNDTIYAKNGGPNRIDGGPGTMDTAIIDQGRDDLPLIHVEKPRYQTTRRSAAPASGVDVTPSACPTPTTDDADEWSFLGPSCFPLKRPTIKCNSSSSGALSIVVTAPPQIAADNANTGALDWQFVSWTMVVLKWNADAKQWQLVKQIPWYWDEAYDLFDSDQAELPENSWRQFDPGHDNLAVNLIGFPVPLPEPGYYTVEFKEHWYPAPPLPPLQALPSATWVFGSFDMVSNKYAVTQDPTGAFLPAPYCRFPAPGQTQLPPPLTIPAASHYFADVTGDKKADWISVRAINILVSYSTGSNIGPGFYAWTDDAFSGARGTYFADVNGDGKADAIAVGNDTVSVRLSSGHRFGPAQDWTHGPYYNQSRWGMFIADVTGDGKADAIVVNDNTISVRPSMGSAFGTSVDWTPTTPGPFHGTRGTYFADVNGDGDADLIAVNDDTVTVRLSTGAGFGPAQDWTHGPYYPTSQWGMYFADVDGDGKADAIVVNDNNVIVRRSTGTSFAPSEPWTKGPFHGKIGTFFADFDGDGKADAIAYDGGSTVRWLPSSGSSFQGG